MVSSGNSEFHLRPELKRTSEEEAEDEAELAQPRAVSGHKGVYGVGRDLAQARRCYRRGVLIMDALDSLDLWGLSQTGRTGLTQSLGDGRQTA